MKKAWSLTYTVLFGLVLLGMVGLTMSYWISQESRKMHQQAMVDHSFLSLLNMVLEVRRYEKNYFIYHEKNFMEMAFNYLDQIEQQLRERRWAFLTRANGERSFQEMSGLLKEYRELLLRYARFTDQDSSGADAMETTLHQTSQRWLHLAENLAADTNDDITGILRTIHNGAMLFNVFYVALLFACGIWLVRRTVRPLACIRDGLTAILAGRRELLPTAGEDEEFVSLVRVLNMTLSHIWRDREERTRGNQQGFADAVMLRMLRMLGQPMANISTTCQILLEEDQRTLTGFQRDMLSQIHRQAEQGGRMLAAVQEQYVSGDEPPRTLPLRRLLDKVLEKLRKMPGNDCEVTLDIPEDLAVNGHPLILEQGLCDLFALGMRGPHDGPLVVRGARRVREAMREALAQAVMRPLIWLHPECDEVVEIALTIRMEGQCDAENVEDPNGRDPFVLCLPLEDGTPGISLLPGMLRRHGGALLAEPGPDAWVAFRLWLPVAPVSGEGMDRLGGAV
ncbi:MAG: HAMP domain-containing histidine kinase [Magnetococcales bacterium]|nr:HAMP domain-containing histidine kinase [Magnetococcales bacterium]